MKSSVPQQEWWDNLYTEGDLLDRNCSEKCVSFIHHFVSFSTIRYYYLSTFVIMMKFCGPTLDFDRIQIT